MTEPDNEKQKEKDEALQRRKEELEGELERYAQAGAFSPGLIKVTRWISRLLYLAMGVTLVVVLFSGWGKVSQNSYDTAVKRANDIKKTADEAKKKLAESETGRAVAEAKLKLLQSQLDRLKETKEGKQAADAAERRAAALAGELGDALQADKLKQAYRDAKDETGLDLLALYATCDGVESGLMKTVATSERPLAEKIIAVRWMGARKDESSRTLLKSLSEGDGVLADEAKQALKQLEE